VTPRVEQLSQLLGKQLGQLFYAESPALVFKVDKALGQGLKAPPIQAFSGILAPLSILPILLANQIKTFVFFVRRHM